MLTEAGLRIIRSPAVIQSNEFVLQAAGSVEMLSRSLLGLIMFLFVGILSGADAKSLSIEARFDALQEIIKSNWVLPEEERARLIADSYERSFRQEFAGRALEKLPDADLDFLYRAADATAFYAPREKYVEDMAAIVEVMQSEGLASDRHYKGMYKAYIGARMIDEARQLSNKHPLLGFEALPGFRGGTELQKGKPVEWVVNTEKREIAPRTVDLNKLAQVIVVSHPLCKFSRNAVQAIMTDPLLGEVFINHAKWISPQDRYLHFDVIQQWNREHANAPVSVTYKSADWTMLDSWATPTFYFLEKGGVVEKIVGWPEEGHRDKLLAALRRVGLLPAEK